MKTVSVVIPVYNVENYLSYCLESLLSQTGVSLEIILVDDGSTDGSGALCDHYSAEHACISVIHQKNSGVSTARNTGLRHAKGDFISFVDPDDWFAEGAYSALVQAMERDGSDAAFCGFWESYEEQSLTPILHSPKCTGVVDGYEALRQCLIVMGEGYFTSVWNKIFRRSTLFSNSQIPLFRPNLSIGEDELWLAEVLPNLQKVSLLSEPFYFWRQRAGSALHSEITVSPKWYTALESKKLVIDRLVEKPELYALSRAKLYNDLFHLIWFAYYSHDRQAQRFFRRELSPYRREFFRSSYFSKLKKMKYIVTGIMVRLHLPRSVVLWLGSKTSYRVKEKLGVSKSEI